MSVTYDESNRFLGMLAEVAVKTLNAEQQKHCNRHKCRDDKLKVNKNVLNVEQLKELSDKMLVELFSESFCDEFRRVFGFKCLLMPNQCDVVFESFANDDKARSQIRDHLLDHIRNLEPNFIAETLNSRSKRSLNEPNKSCRKRSKKETKSDLKTNGNEWPQTRLITDHSNTKDICNQSSAEISFDSKSTAKQIEESIDSLAMTMTVSKELVEDHCYTSLEGPKVRAKALEKCDKNSVEGKKGRPKARADKLDATEVIATPAFPFIYEPILPNISQVIEIDSTLHNNNRSDGLQHSFAKSDITDETVLEDELNANTLQLKRLALQYINDIRVKNRGQTDKSSFRCKICIDKTFTSPTTLIYHYRSHAGVKPYECSLCKATFTRQHSLNYHTLIHLNKSRFVCDECGRNFRHPSHFKEHMRRHTGETPYECTDCYIKFKTRNTYKRHLQTKHAKMLTSKGIFDLPDSTLHLRKPCPPRRKYGLGFLHQNIEAVARYERAQQEVSQTIRSNCHRINSIDSNHHLLNSCNKGLNSGKNNFEKLLQAVAIAEDNQRTYIQ